jgi:molybdenum cofactor cytidylyltransferase
MSVFAILLSGGLSTRMGQNKALMPWKGKTLLQYHLDQFRKTAIEKTIVVLGFEAEKLLPLVEKETLASAIINNDYFSGRCSSIKTGMRALPFEASSVIMLSVDQPRPYSLLAELLDVHVVGGNLITVPVYQGARGHPAIFSRELFPEMLEISEERLGLREVMLRHEEQVVELPMSSPVVLVDLNNPGDYKKALDLIV